MNVIKQRQLSNGEKLTPKTDFVYHSLTTNVVSINDLNGNVKGNYRTSLAIPIRVGKGQIIDFQGGVPNMSICLVDGNGTQLNSLTIDTNWDGVYHTNKKVITFLGKPFANVGDNDRYIFLNTTDTVYGGGGGAYTTTLFNIDKWEVLGIAQNNDLVSEGVKHDFTFDGVDKVYFIYKDTIRFITIDSTGQTSWGEVKDNTDTVVSSTRIFGVNQTEIVYKSDTGTIRKYVISTGETFIIGGSSSNEILNCVMSPIIKDNGDDYLLLGFKEGQIFYRNTTNTKTYDLTQAMVDNAMIGPGETGVSPQLITNFEETDTTIIFTMIYTRTASGAIGYGTFNIDRASGTITILNAFWRDNVVYGISQEILNNSFSNTCNSYGVGTFYNYGLQKQWDTQNSKKEVK